MAEASKPSAAPPAAGPKLAPESSLPTGPLHKEGLVCFEDALASCARCQRKVFTLTTCYFQKEFSDQATKSHGVDAVRNVHCTFMLTHVRFVPKQNVLSVAVVCPGHLCTNSTGQLQRGLLGVELLQYHTTKEHLSEFGPLKKCGCPIHIRLHLICSEACYKSSIFNTTKPPGDVNWEDVSKMLTLSTRGPVALVQQYLLDVMATDMADEEVKKILQIPEDLQVDEAPAVTESDECHVCKKTGAAKWCSRCKNRSIKYCSRECQVKDWQSHKETCNASAT